ncbi:MAG: membrane protein insertase YidC [Myxococcota bacterium]
MDRVQIAAIVLAVGILLFWYSSVQKSPPPTARAPVPAESPPSYPSEAEAEPPPPASSRTRADDALPVAAVLTQARSSLLENDELQVDVSHLGGRLRSVRLLDYADRLGPEARPVELVTEPERGTLLVFLGDGPFQGLESAEHELVRSGSTELTLRVRRDGVTVTRTLTLDPHGFGGRLRVRVDNGANKPVRPLFQLALSGRERPASAPDHFQNYGLVVSSDGSLVRRPLSSKSPFGCAGGGNGAEKRMPAPVEWGGLDSQYFLLAAIPEDPSRVSAAQAPLGELAARTVLSYPPIEVPPGAYVERTYRLYLGPKVQERVVEIDPRLTPAVRTGWVWVRPLVNLFVAMLSWTYANLIPNYGVAIILLTILVRVLTAPLTYRSMKSMRGMSVLAPEMKALQDKYKDDRARLQQEMMSLYRRRGINPLTAMGGGCLPMLIQMPFLLALYFALQSSIELRHAPFVFWIRDLSAPEDFLSIAGVPIRPLPLLMGVSMVLQQRLTPTSATADPSQRQMMMWMSVFFIFIFYSFPAGLVLYWFVSNILAIAQQVWMNRGAAGGEGGAEAGGRGRGSGRS